MKTWQLLLVAVHVAAFGSAIAQGKDPWIGRRAFTQPGTVHLLRGG